MKVKWFRISLVFTYKKWNTGALHGHLEIQNFPSLLEGLFTRTQLTGLARLLGQTSPWVHMGNFSPVSEVREGQRCWGRVLALNSKNKANKAKHKNLTFAPIIASAALKAVSLQLQIVMGCLWHGKYSMQCKTMQSGLPEFILHSSRSLGWSIHMVKFPAYSPISRFFHARSREPSWPALSYEHIENLQSI